MLDGAREVRGPPPAQQVYPANRQRGQELERRGDGRAGLRCLGPLLLLVGSDRRSILGEPPLEAQVRVHVAVGQMMGDLPDGPSALAIRRVELSIVETDDRAAEARRRGGDLLDRRGALGSRKLLDRGEPSYRITLVAH